ncbi:bifunctional (p)ppGpp synthetase/guanosine-3',5'-bis(diphosphate) 3'-pyrophosphohydrolase [Synechocystis sp. PCC 7339]|uniref:HD domain-containing protein n=1 Tax=unclassified Synechocystis TaxID=2640012 RepID=UPI001BB06946|nr:MULTISPECIES: HD domain-containing protein [unclassified Synechocystis]QUS61633.1 bifunctional (p)ppGpp synthetase/guanosine-3',5'-bis(diphosphate) 3'-pyrophosphohydrolase [Synechocystis sp. PCC 7338]UAJ73831.1 bifunctional (p)ppGpp synthetase/guanosine-3',5'-bis(diphosphate) 3'-pyrophosphohydrolase [Synechocystis sp. PCC 7339]
MNLSSPPALTDRFSDALVLANQLHAEQYRKGSRVPYVSHLLGVTALVLEMGGNEDEAIAALLHDAVEDQGGMETLTMIEHQFGQTVAALIRACSDSTTVPKPPWEQRKQEHLAKMRQVSLAVLKISLADTLHNARTIAIDLRRHGDEIWQEFNRGKSGILWYYQSIWSIYQDRNPNAWSNELIDIIDGWRYGKL